MVELDAMTLVLLISAGKISIDTELNISIDRSLPSALSSELGAEITEEDLLEIVQEFVYLTSEILIEIGEEAH